MVRRSGAIILTSTTSACRGCECMVCGWPGSRFTDEAAGWFRVWPGLWVGKSRDETLSCSLVISHFASSRESVLPSARYGAHSSSSNVWAVDNDCAVHFDAEH